ncbi:class I SAM-dependent DNA methyltransferase [Algicella marina]|uniref:site-specific DNA-methyltransferase (adenine-specific) n=1 Tax=Algicella marina TaxID=2683284 RepID=A0A6P1SZP7_9RHOB|nr:DNA methyltransferase [Algicella marina]QHQ35227.1 lactate dehydrogenase [Algicella marina]
MNAVEIEEAISALAEQPFDVQEFSYAFLEAFGNKATTLKRLRTGASNKSDLGGVLQTNNIHIAVCDEGDVTQTLAELKASPSTTKAKAKFVLATDGADLEAEDLTTGETIACAFKDFPDHFGFFLPLAGISTVKQIRESSFDIKATGRLNRLYVELLKDNPEWGTAERRHDMNHFMARLIFCFFAEDTDIFASADQFTKTIEQMSERDSSNTHEVISELFRAMNTKAEDRTSAGIARWANAFPYVNGGLFSGTTDVPRFSRIARSYLIHIGSLDWTKINPDIFGSMIQAVADDEERGALGMHYTSVPNILKVLNPLFLDDLREKLEEAGENPRKLLNLRNRIAKIRVFDPACGSGNFLVIAYKEMRAIEAEINERRDEADRRTEIPLTNYRGIELRDFPAEIARLALIIAEYQCDVTYRGQKEALAEFLPLDAMNWITCGNALRLDWLSICPPTGTGVKHHADDLFMSPVDQAEIDFENEGGETYICGNPPYIWANNQTAEQKQEVLDLQEEFGTRFRGLDYVTGWLYKYATYSRLTLCDAAFVTTNSITQGEQVDPLWSGLIGDGCALRFAFRSFKWQNLAKSNAGVSVVIVGLTREQCSQKLLFDGSERIVTSNISPYLLPMENVWVKPSTKPLNHMQPMMYGSKPVCGGGLTLTLDEAREIIGAAPDGEQFIKNFVGSDEITSGKMRKCIWIDDDKAEKAKQIGPVNSRLEVVRETREKSKKKQTRDFALRPHRFIERRRSEGNFIALPCVSSEARDFLTPIFSTDETVVSNRCFGVYDVELWYLSIISSKIHYTWCETTSGKLETRLNYSNTLTWNNFPIPNLTEKNKTDLTRCAEEILLAREAHFPATIADLYDPEKMPADLRAAHDRNDETLERIYIGRRFRNDTERLEKLFELYTKMKTKAA